MSAGCNPVTPEIAAMLEHATRQRFPAKRLIVQEGEEPDVLYYIVSGSVTVLVEDPEGGELILAYLGPGEFFGELSLFVADAKRSASVRSRTDCEVAVITHEKFRALIATAPKLFPPLIGQLARRLRATSQKLGDLAFVDVAGRIARALLDLAGDSQAITHPQGMLVRITREELGRLVNCSREVAGRVLFDLEQRGLIEAHGKSIVVRGVFLSYPGPPTKPPKML